MVYRIDSKSGNKVSAIGFGCMRFSRTSNGKIDIDKTEKLVISAIEQGINYFDTAYAYSGSEATLGEILDKHRLRDKVFIATKLYWPQCNSYDDFENMFQESLKRLKTRYVDYYLVHNISSSEDWNKLCSFGIKQWLLEKKSKDLIHRAGFSFHGSLEQFSVMLDSFDWDFCQIQYNYINQNFQAGRKGLLEAHKNGLPVIIMEPLLGGALASLPKAAEALFKKENDELSPAGWALRWLWNQSEVTVVLSGMKTQEQLNDNINVAKASHPNILTENEKELFNKVASILKKNDKIPCTGCSYCIPCPQKVIIPECFSAYNASYTTGRIQNMLRYMKRNARGSNCVKCRKCEKQCPQQIKIVDNIEMITRRLEPFWFRPFIKLFIKLTSKKL